MSNVGFTLKAAKDGFFDRKRVIDAIGRERAKVLSKMGAYVRQRAKSSIRPAPKNTAKKSYLPQAGKPPRSHTGLLKDFILFSWDPSSESVVVGPTLLGGFHQSTPAPQLLEHGGQVEFFASGKRLAKTCNFRAFPFMQPALTAEMPNFPQLWAGAIRS